MYFLVESNKQWRRCRGFTISPNPIWKNRQSYNMIMFQYVNIIFFLSNNYSNHIIQLPCHPFSIWFNHHHHHHQTSFLDRNFVTYFSLFPLTNLTFPFHTSYYPALLNTHCNTTIYWVCATCGMGSWEEPCHDL